MTGDVFISLGRTALEALWLPMAVWTAVALPAMLLLNHLAETRAAVAYRGHQALLFALPVGLLAGLVVRTAAPLWPAAGGGALPAGFTLHLPAVVLDSSTGVAQQGVTLFHAACGALLLAAAALALFRLGTLVAGYVALRRFRRTLPPAEPRLAARARHLAGDAGVARRVRVVRDDRLQVPMTFGRRAPVVVLPEDLQGDELDMALRHELIHVRRNDYAWNVLEAVAAALFAVHPLTGRLHRRCTFLREVCCDAEVLDTSASQAAPYARLLLRLATRSTPSRVLAVGIVHPHHLKNRIHAMKHQNRTRTTHTGLPSLLLALVMLGLGAFAVACTEVVDIGGEQTADVATSETAAVEGEVFAVADQMPRLLPSQQEALAALHQDLRYPETAKTAGIEGRVLVEFIVDKEGRIRQPAVKKGVGAGLDAEALRVVQDLRFAPGSQNGTPVNVRMVLPIVFRLPEADA